MQFDETMIMGAIGSTILIIAGSMIAADSRWWRRPKARVAQNNAIINGTRIVKEKQMTEVWYHKKIKKSMILLPNCNSHWYLKWHDGWGCWTITGIDLYWLIDNGWSKL